MSQTFVHDFYHVAQGRRIPSRTLLKLTRMVTLVMGISALLLAATVLNIFHLAVSAVSFGVALIPAVLGAFFWKRATSCAAFWSIIGGAMVIAISLPFLSEQAFLPGITVSGGTFVLLSFLSKRPSP